jgi:hypothetical protein
LAPFHRGTSFELIFMKNGLGYILGDSFTNSSGHPGFEGLGMNNFGVFYGHFEYLTVILSI